MDLVSLNDFQSPNDFWNWMESDLIMNKFNDSQLDIYEDDQNFYVEVAAPGYNKEDIEVNIKNNVLTVSGELSETSDGGENNINYHYRSIERSGFNQSVKLPRKIDETAIEASYDKGMLKVSIPKENGEEDKKMKIDIE